MFTVLNEAIQADMEHLQTGTQTVPCAVTQALMKMDAGLTANLGKIRNTACCMLAMQKECNKAPPAFGLGTQTCITSRRQFQINKSWVYQGDQAHSSMAASKKKKKKLPKNHGRVCLVSSEAVHHGKHQGSKLASHLGGQPYLEKAKHLSVWATGCHLLLSSSVMSDSLRPHGLQHTRLPCPSSSPRVCSNSCPLSQ